jgi:hypothetical protein
VLALYSGVSLKSLALQIIWGITTAQSFKSKTASALTRPFLLIYQVTTAPFKNKKNTGSKQSYDIKINQQGKP